MNGQVTTYQVFVTDTAAGHEIPIGPRVDVKDALNGLVEQTNLAIMRGRLKGWKDAHIVTVDPSDGRRVVS